MKLLETLTSQQKIDLFAGRTVGFFQYLLTNSEPYHDKLTDLCTGYYLTRSGEKTISPTYDKILTAVKEEIITSNPDELLASLIRAKFVDKWNRVYDVLLGKRSNYDPLNDREFTVDRTGNNTDSTTYGKTKTHTGTNTDTTEYGSITEDDGKTATQESTTRTIADSDAVYGFNSSSAVNDSESSEVTTESVVGDADKNTTYNKQTRSGEDTKTMGFNESEADSGTDAVNHIIDEYIERKGRNVAGADLVEQELKLRNKEIFFDIIYADIDSIVTIPLYI